MDSKTVEGYFIGYDGEDINEPATEKETEEKLEYKLRNHRHMNELTTFDKKVKWQRKNSSQRKNLKKQTTISKILCGNEPQKK